MPTHRTPTHRTPTRRIISALAAIALAAAIGGCGGGSTATQSANVTTTTTVSSPTATTSSATTTTSASATSATTQTTSTSTSATHVKPAQTGGTAATKPAKPLLGRLAVSSAAFPHGGNIPARYTCDGANISPPLRWGKVPAGTAQIFLLALSLTPSAQGAIHWAVGGIDPGTGGFAAGQLPPGAVVGRGSSGRDAWSGICPPHGKSQSIVVLVYALRHPLNLAPGFDPTAVQRQLTDNNLGSGVVYGTYRRS